MKIFIIITHLINSITRLCGRKKYFQISAYVELSYRIIKRTLKNRVINKMYFAKSCAVICLVLF